MSQLHSKNRTASVQCRASLLDWSTQNLVPGSPPCAIPQGGRQVWRGSAGGCTSPCLQAWRLRARARPAWTPRSAVTACRLGYVAAAPSTTLPTLHPRATPPPAGPICLIIFSIVQLISARMLARVCECCWTLRLLLLRLVCSQVSRLTTRGMRTLPAHVPRAALPRWVRRLTVTHAGSAADCINGVEHARVSGAPHSSAYCVGQSPARTCKGSCKLLCPLARLRFTRLDLTSTAPPAAVPPRREEHPGQVGRRERQLLPAAQLHPHHHRM